MKMTTLSGKAILVLAIAIGLTGAAWACDHDAKAAGMAANADGDMGSHCLMMKGVSKEAKLTSDGAVITMTGKNAEAVTHIKEHLASCEKGGDSPDCPLASKDDVFSVEMTPPGGVVTAHAKTPEALKSLQEWANSKGCCNKDKKA